MKDYYAILGVVPSAEEVVIRATWKALVQRYHPDRFHPNVAEATARIAEVNEAYNVLSDPVRRKNYDSQRGTKEGDFGSWMHEEEADQAINSIDPFENDWTIAVEYYPDLVEINDRLSRISKLLAFSFRASVLEQKAFEKRKELAQFVEIKFLQAYFGSNPEIVDFARHLIFDGRKPAAKALNNAVRVLGSEIPARVIIDKIRKDFFQKTVNKDELQIKEEIRIREKISLGFPLDFDEIEFLKKRGIFFEQA